jgi:preprotein translocase subunit SecA
MNQQREVIYKQRRDLLTGVDLKSTIEDIMMECAEDIAVKFADERALPEDWEWEAIGDAVFQQFNFRPSVTDADTLDGLTAEGLAQEIYEQAHRRYEEKAAMLGGGDDFRQLERMIMLQTVDNLWKDHLLSMDHLKEGIGLRGYAQQNPLLVYKKEGFEMFQETIDRIKSETLGILFRIQLAEPDHIDDLRKPMEQKLVFSGSGDGPATKKPVKRQTDKVGRNAPCPCGSGKKFKKCCGG